MENKKDLFDRYCLRWVSKLEEDEKVMVGFNGDNGALQSDILNWERKNAPCKLAEDLKGFYSMFNGLHLEWRVSIRGAPVLIGDITINSLDKLDPVQIDGKFLGNEVLTIVDTRSCHGFILSSCIESGRVLLIYSNNTPSIWYQDEKKRYHYLTDSFSNYMRLNVANYGIIGWQDAYTPEGLSEVTYQWMSMYCKARLLMNVINHKKLCTNES